MNKCDNCQDAVKTLYEVPLFVKAQTWCFSCTELQFPEVAKVLNTVEMSKHDRDSIYLEGFKDGNEEGFKRGYDQALIDVEKHGRFENVKSESPRSVTSAGSKASDSLEAGEVAIPGEAPTEDSDIDFGKL